MKKRLLSLFFLLFIPSLIASCDTKIEESKNNDNNSSITGTSLEDSSSTREKDSFPEKSSSSYESITFESSSVKTEPYGYTIEDGKMTIDVTQIHYCEIDDDYTSFSKITSGNTYNVYELDVLKIESSIETEKVISDNESVNIFKNSNGFTSLEFEEVGSVKITINYENEEYGFFFNILEAEIQQIVFIATQEENLFFDKENGDLAYIRGKFDHTNNIIPGCEYTLMYKGYSYRLDVIPYVYVYDYSIKIISFNKTSDANLETFIITNGKAYVELSESVIYPFFYTYYLQDAYDDLVEFAIDENGKIVLIEDLPDNTVLYGYVNDGIVYGYYTYDVNEKEPILAKKY